MKATKKRISYARIKEVYDIPNLVEIQTRSYSDFLQRGAPKTKRAAIGLEEVFAETFPIVSKDGEYSLEYVNYIFSNPKYEIEECRKKGLSYAVPLKAKIRLKSKKEVKEQEVYICDIPLMTPTGTFIINGDERVVVSQLHRSPGVSFEESIHPNGKKIYSARIIPYHGAWIEFEFDVNDLLHVYIDRRRKFLATIILRIFGYSSNQDILKAFSGIDDTELTRSSQLTRNIGRTLAKKAEDEKGNLIAPENAKLTKEIAEKVWESGIRQISLYKKDFPELRRTLERDYTKTKEEALLDVYRRLRPGDPPTVDSAQSLIDRMFFDPKRYDLTNVGRFILNRKLDMNLPLNSRIITKDTLVNTIEYLIRLKAGEGDTDDIDHLGNRRVRSVGELLQNQFRIAMARVERTAKERMNIYDLNVVMPHNLINTKLIASIVKDFFGRSQLSQFMDQTNPLAELTHKRRLSALGPGGLSRERAGFEVRDVHHSHYGRICPIETPEGPNIGLIASLCTYGRINKYGFIESPYRKVSNGRVTEKIDYLSADLEDKTIIAQANAVIDKSGKFQEDFVLCRHRGDFPRVIPKDINYMDVSPRQLVSVAASLIPFLEHDDANRALMGSNMQRQAVPLLETEAPLIGTGMEYRSAKDSGAVVIAENDGRVNLVQSDEIVVGGKSYNLRKYQKSNASTCINQRPIVKLGDYVKEGQIIADGAATKDGELALGRNVLVAFMPWRGYNFEDAILVSEKLIKEDMYTSIHIEEFELEARETRLGNEEITRDIPNVGEDALRNLDANGIIAIGAEVHAGDILVGKVAPKSETELSPEEKLLRAIFGEKAGDVRDASLVAPPGIEGIAVDVRVFSRKETRSRTKEERTKELREIERISKKFQDQIKKLQDDRDRKLSTLLIDKKIGASLLDDDTGEVLLSQNKTIKKSDMKKIARCDLDDLKIPDEPRCERESKQIAKVLDAQLRELSYELEREIDKIKRGDELPPGVLKKVVVYVASKRKLSVGDKMAGRHGNKGVIAKIVPEEDMPFTSDGTPVEVVLNPLGVPSRMNVGQLLETHLGWAAKVLGVKFASPVFDGATEKEIKDELKKAGLPQNGKLTLYDGLTGEPFDQMVTIGYIYIMKLAHLVDDKMHARSIGPYSLVTQQPLGGKAQFGGQRFGEMEVWALEAYGAAYCLQELLTVKSDDVLGRTRIYESIVKGENTLQPGIPESFNVLLKELQGLGLDVRLEKTKEKEEK
ncbi:MAG: DNA-directed RNA polymerase subunit beta [Candidatus Omnitrophica bacterium]|nr:DNA-directed RNA polymerase subunit beta [Candidatus Omnitrophota bacterium]